MLGKIDSNPEDLEMKRIELKKTSYLLYSILLFLGLIITILLLKTSIATNICVGIPMIVCFVYLDILCFYKWICPFIKKDKSYFELQKNGILIKEDEKLAFIDWQNIEKIGIIFIYKSGKCLGIKLKKVKPYLDSIKTIEDLKDPIGDILSNIQRKIMLALC